MFATYALLQITPGKLDDFKALMLAWMEPGAVLPRGFVSADPYQSADDPNRIMLSVVFESHESFVLCTAGVDDDEAYQQMSALLDGPLDWQDAEVETR
jgi:quinol monooxygenase YgiN